MERSNSFLSHKTKTATILSFPQSLTQKYKGRHINFFSNNDVKFHNKLKCLIPE